jgi:hypothetical protein
MTTRRWFGLTLAILSSGFTCQPRPGQPPASLSWSRLELNSASDGRRLIYLDALRSMSIALRESDLADARGVCLGDVVARFQRGGYEPDSSGREIRLEAHIYLRDPNEVHDTLAAMTDAKVLDGTWAAETNTPEGRPRVLVMPIPTPPSGSTSHQAALGTAYYPAWHPGPSRFVITNHPEMYQCHALASPNTIGSGHAVRGLALYDRGTCENSVSIGGVIAPKLLSQALNRVKDGLSKAGAITTGHRYNVAASYTRFEQSIPKGGLFWAFHFVANEETHIWGNFRLELVLNDRGVPSLDVKELAYHATGGMASTWGRALHDGSVFNKPLADETRVGFENGATQQLLITTPFVAAVSCEENDTPEQLATKCSPVAADLAKLAVPESRQVDGRVLTQAERDRLKCSIGDASGCGDDSRARAIRTQRWICGEFPDGSTTGKCNFVIPVKRINALPDQLGLVFFDNRYEFDNAALAVAQLAEARMCAAPEPIGNATWATYGLVTRDPFASSVQIDPWPNPSR